MQNKYWFSLSASVFVWRKKDRCLLYNSKTFAGKLYKIDNEMLNSFTMRLSDIDNLHCVEITQSELENESLKTTIQDLINCKMGQLVKQDDSLTRKPIQFPPILNLQTDVDKLKDEKLTDMAIGEHILENLHEANIILPENADDQFMKALVVFLDSLTGSYTSSIIISGYCSQLNIHRNLWENLNLLQIPKTFIFNVQDISPHLITQLKELDVSNFKIRIIVSPAYFNAAFKQLNEMLASFSILSEWEFLIEDVLDYDNIHKIISEHELRSDLTNIKPFYTGKNLSFFENHIYLDEEDIWDSENTKRQIFANQALNTNNFGKITITPDGKVYANLFHQPLGSIDDDIRELVYKEMTNGSSWLQIRNMKPCADCVYQWLCPSLSDYEYAIGKPNLCTVKV